MAIVSENNALTFDRAAGAKRPSGSRESKSDPIHFVPPSERSDLAPDKRYVAYRIGSSPCEENAYLVWKLIQ